MKIAFVFYWSRASEILPNWRDGLRAAIELIGKDHQVEWFLDEKVPDPKEKWDFILFWGDSYCPFFDKLGYYSCRKGICLSTLPDNYHNLEKIDVVYCESQVVYEAVRQRGVHAIKAFGTDTDFFIPDETVKKDIEFFYPATFSPWKRQSTIAYLGNKLLCVGTVQPDGNYELEECQKNGVQIEIGYFPVEKIRQYYRRAKHVIIPAVHGSERTALEAMSMNIIPIITSENRKTFSYVEELCRELIFPPREFILKNYSHKVYAQNLLKGING